MFGPPVVFSLETDALLLTEFSDPNCLILHRNDMRICGDRSALVNCREEVVIRWGVGASAATICHFKFNRSHEASSDIQSPTFAYFK